MGGGKSSSKSSGALRFPPYLEAAHNSFLTGNDGKNVFTAFNAAWDKNPYAGREDILPEDGYLGRDGTGVAYKIWNFPSLFDMYGKFMAGLDIEILWTQTYYSMVNGPEAGNLIATFDQETRDTVLEGSYPALHAGMRDIGSINSSTFVIGRELLEAKRLKEVNKFSAQVKFQLLQMTNDRWIRHLEWNKNVVMVYNDMMKLYYTAEMDADAINYKYSEVEALWNLNLFEYARSMLGALTGTPANAKAAGGPSSIQKALGGALGGAAAGVMIGAEIGAVGGPMGAAIGGVLGAASGFL